MAKVLSLEETMAQWCQIREGETTAETAHVCQKEESTARECQTAWSARQRRQSERIKNAAAFRRRQAQGQRKQVAKMRKKGAAAIPHTVPERSGLLRRAPAKASSRSILFLPCVFPPVVFKVKFKGGGAQRSAAANKNMIKIFLF
jgi:hypothetical protein